MKWVPRKTPGSSVTLWRSILENAQAVEGVISRKEAAEGVSHPTILNDTQLPAYDDDVNETPFPEFELGSDQDAECDTDVDYPIPEVKKPAGQRNQGSGGGAGRRHWS